MTEYYKWLQGDGRTTVQNVRWPVAVGDWTAVEVLRLCIAGWHGMEERHVLNHLPGRVGAQLWRVSVRGDVVVGDDKFAAASMRLDYMLGVTTEQNLRLFACDIAEDVLDHFEAKYPGDHRPREAVNVARRFAVGEATDQELSAASAAARTAANSSWSADAWTAAAAYAASAAARTAANSSWSADAWTAAAAAWSASAAAAYAASAAPADAWEKYSNWLVVRIESGC